MNAKVQYCFPDMGFTNDQEVIADKVAQSSIKPPKAGPRKPPVGAHMRKPGSVTAWNRAVQLGRAAAAAKRG